MFYRMINILVLVVTYSTAIEGHALASDDETRLLSYLFEHKGYNNLIRPVSNFSQSILIKFNLGLIQVISLEEKTQVMRSNVWLRQSWFDYQLQWDPEDFGGIKIFRVNYDKVWLPEIVLFNNADGNYQVSWASNVLIYYDGTILWIPPAIYLSSCTIEVLYFPFDEQICEMKFGSLTYNAQQVNLTWLDSKNYMSLNDYWISGTWDIIECPGSIEHIHQKGHDNIVEIVYKVKLRRKTLFYTVNLIIPLILIAFLSAFVFYLPSDVGEKITLCISVLLALVVFLLLTSKILPPTSMSIPLISKYLLFTFIMNIITIFVTVFTINWNFRTPSTHTMPRSVRTIFMYYLPMLLRMGVPDHIAAKMALRKRKQESLRSTANENSSNYCDSRDDAFSSVSSPRVRRARKNGNQSDESDVSQTQRSLLDLEDHQGILCSHHPRCHHAHPLSLRASTLEAGESSSTTQLRGRRGDEQQENLIEEASTSLPQLSDRPVKFRGIEITPDMREALLAINFISAHFEASDSADQEVQDWKFVASVIDRFCLVVFGIVTFVGTIGILMNSPYIFMEYVDQNEIMKKYL